MINVTDDVEVTQVNITVNNTPYAVTNRIGDIWNITLNAPTNGTHIIYVNAYDLAENSDYDDSESITVDDSDPVITLQPTLQYGYVIPASTIINFTVTDDNLDTVQVNITPGNSAGSNRVNFASPYDVDTT